MLLTDKGIERRIHRMKRLVLAAGVLLFILHHDFWWWSDATLWFGFLPTGLAYHGLYVLLVAAFWVWAIRVAWPVDEPADRPADSDPGPGSGSEGNPA